MGENGGEGLFILAAVVIAFVNWLSTSLKKKAAEKEQERRRARGEPIAPQRVVQPTESWPQPDAPAAQPSNANDQLRAFFDSLAQPPPPPPPDQLAPAPSRRTSSSIPQRGAAARHRSEPESWKTPVVKRATLTAEERRAFEGLEQSALQSRRRRRGAHPLIAKLRESGGARDAILFAEILGKPKALADS